MVSLTEIKIRVSKWFGGVGRWNDEFSLECTEFNISIGHPYNRMTLSCEIYVLSQRGLSYVIDIKYKLNFNHRNENNQCIVYKNKR